MSYDLGLTIEAIDYTIRNYGEDNLAPHEQSHIDLEITLHVADMMNLWGGNYAKWRSTANL